MEIFCIESISQTYFTTMVTHRAVDTILLQHGPIFWSHKINGIKANILYNFTKLFDRKKTVGPLTNRMVDVAFQFQFFILFFKGRECSCGSKCNGACY